MNFKQYLKSNWRFISAVVLVIAILAMTVTALQTFQYKATSRLLVIQKQVASLDAYTATKSAERIAKNLSEIINTSSFYNDVIDSNNSLKNQYSDNELERRKQWQKDIAVEVFPETGILAISAYNADPDYAVQLVRSIAYVLVNKGSDYHGGGKDVEIKIIDNILVSEKPVRPNILLNLAIAILAGFVLANVYLLWQKNRQRPQLALNFEKKEPVAVKKEIIKSEPKYKLILPEQAVKTVKITTIYDHLAALS